MMTPFTFFAHNMAFFNEITRTPQAHWATTNEVIYEDDALRLRQFQTGPRPIMIVPPQAGHGSDIADFDDGQSLVQSAMTSGRAVFCLDWKSCTHSRRNENIDCLVDQVMEAASHVLLKCGVRSRITLAGLCMGGWVSAITAALYPELFETLIVAGAPIDAHGEDGVIQDILKGTPQYVYEGLVQLGGGLMRGQLMLMGWKSGHAADRYLGDYIKLYNAIGTNDLLKIRRFRDWYEKTYDIAGAWYLQAVDQIFRKNNLWKGKLKVHNKLVNLQRLSGLAVSLAGEGDDITPPGQALALSGVHYIIQGVGHVGVFMSKKSQPVWKKIFNMK